MKLASFDIFDTTLIRKCGKPENVFYLLAHRLYPTDRAKREDFVLWRKQAESTARRCNIGKDVTIDDIYDCNELKGFDEYSKKELIEAEKLTEAEQLVANPAIRDVINKKREQGYTICFISDMYLPSGFLKQVLEREGCIKGDEKVYVSCEHNARKSNGTFYKRLKEELTPTAWEHFGDHPISDVRMAKRCGIKTTKVCTDFSAAEKGAILPHDNRHHFESSTLAGLSRAARIHYGNDAYTNIAADFVAPVYIPYVHSIIEKAREIGIRVIYFLSRDSYILQKIAEQLPHEGIELHYLFVSRKALLLPYMHNATAEKFLAIQDKNTIKGKSIKDLVVSLGTSTDELEKDFGIAFDFDKVATKEQEKIFLATIFGTGSRYLPTLNERAKEQRASLNGYFTQEKVFCGDATAMVDVGWLGTTRLMINSILKEEGFAETLFFYYGVRSDVLHSKHGRYITFHSPNTSGTELTFVIEDYLSASPYRTTKGYSFDSGKYNAVLAGKTEYNRIISTNCSVCQWMAEEICKLPHEVKNILDIWEETAINSAKTYIHRIDKAPLTEIGISRKLNPVEFISVVFCGGHKTLYDRASIALSIPSVTFPLVDKIARFTGNIRRRLYLKLYK